MDEKSPKKDAIFHHVDLARMSVYYMLPEHQDFEELIETMKNRIAEVQEMSKTTEAENQKVSDEVLNEDEIIVELLKSSQRCKIYGTSSHFVDELTAFQNFPASHKYFPLKFTTPYYTTPVLYKSVTGERYFCKQDFHTILQYLVQDTVPASKNHVICSLISIFLKSKEDVVNEKTSFRKFEISEFQKIRRDLKTTKCTHFDESGALKSTFFQEKVLEKLRSDFEGILEHNEDSGESKNSKISGKFLKLIPTTWSVEEGQWIEKALENEKIEAGNSKFSYTAILICLYTNATLILKKLDKICRKWAEPTEKEATTVIRVFEDCKKNRFFLKNEIFEALKIEKIQDFKDFDNTKFLKNPLKVRKINPKSKTKNLLTPPTSSDAVYGLLYEDAVKKYELQTTGFEFVRFPILRTSRRAVPFLGPPSSKCVHSQFYIPAVDGLLEILKTLIWGSRIFQKFEFERKKCVYEIFADLGLVFDAQQTTPTMIRSTRIRDLTNAFTKKCQYHQKIDFPPFRDISEDHEFTLEDLKIELENLKLLDFFPGIQDSAERVLNALLPKNQGEKSRKSSEIWFDAIENCQMICMMEVFPKLKAFLHAQKSCRRIAGLECDTCEDLDSEDVTSPENSENSEFAGPPTEKFPDIGGCRIGPRKLTRIVGCAGFEIPEDFEKEDSEDLKDSEDVEVQNQNPEATEDSESVHEDPEIFKNVSEDNFKDPESSEDSEDVENREIQEMDRLEKIQELQDLKELQETVRNLCDALEDRKTSLEEFEGFLRESVRNSKKAEGRIKKLERELSKEREKNQKLKKKNLEFLDFAHENSQLKKRNFEMEEAERKMKEEHQSEITAYTQKLADRNSRIENLERELKKNQDRNEALKNIFTTNSHLNEENERLKEKVSGCEMRETRITEAYEKMKKSFQEDRVKFSERIAEMARSLRCEKMKTSDVEQTSAQLRRQLKQMEDSDSEAQIRNLKEDILEKRRYIQLILETNSQLNSEVDKNRRKFREISKILEPNPSNSAAFGADSKNGRSLILGRGLFEPSPQRGIAPIGAERRQNPPTVPIPSTSTTTTTPFSTVFLYSPPSEATTSSEPTTSSTSPLSSLLLNIEPSELADSECVICLSEVRSDDKIIKCLECRRRFHGKCAADWLKVKSICPTCKGKLLDPDEFPAL